MRLLLVVSDPEAVRAIERNLLAGGHSGFTVIPDTIGSGRTGLHAGERVHPGGTSVLFTVVPDEHAEAVVSAMRAGRDRAAAHDHTHIYSVPAEEVS